MMERGLYRIINSTLVAIICLLCLQDVQEKLQIVWYEYGIVLLTIVGLTFFCCLKQKGRLIFGVLVTTAILGILWIVGWEQLDRFEDIWLVGIAFASFILQFLGEKLFVIKGIFAGGLTALLLVDLFFTKKLEHVTVVCIVMVILLAFVEGTQIYWDKQKSTAGKVYIVWIMPFLCLYFILMLLTPAPAKAYDWRFVKDTYSRLKESFTVITQEISGWGKEDFVTVASGFSGDGKLLGGVTEIGREVMYIQGQKSLKTNVYLTGKVYDSFSGRAWQQNYEQETLERELDALETIYAIRRYDSENAKNYICSTRLNLSCGYFHTKYLFVPLKAWNVESQLPYKNKGGTLLLDEKMNYGTVYDLNFFQLNVGHQKFYDMLVKLQEQKQENANDVWTDVLKEYGGRQKTKLKLKDLETHREEVYKVYGEEIVVSKEVRGWLATVTEGCEKDIEKLRAIEEALSKFTYTKAAGALPSKITSTETFLDYFLLENKQGFCSYFATTFVLLARAEGIPARYAEGFCVPVEGDGTIVVTSNMAHAWPEAYIEGVGWIPFEPTPGYGEIRYTPWEMTNVQKEKAGNTVENSEVLEEELPEDAVAEEDVLEQKEQEKWFTEKNTEILVFLIILIVSVAILIWYLEQFVSKYRYHRWTMEEKIMFRLQHNMVLLGLLGYQRGGSETLEELEKRAWVIMAYEEMEKERELQFLKIYQDILYGRHAVEAEMLELVCKEGKHLARMLKKWKPLLYVYYRLLYIL